MPAALGGGQAGLPVPDGRWSLHVHGHHGVVCLSDSFPACGGGACLRSGHHSLIGRQAPFGLPGRGGGCCWACGWRSSSWGRVDASLGFSPRGSPCALGKALLFRKESDHLGGQSFIFPGVSLLGERGPPGGGGILETGRRRMPLRKGCFPHTERTVSKAVFRWRPQPHRSAVNPLSVSRGLWAVTRTSRHLGQKVTGSPVRQLLE